MMVLIFKDKSSIRICIVITSLGLLSLLKATDPCMNYKVISNYKRSVSYFSPDATSICDNLLIPGWYRVDSPAGEKMPEQCPPSGACGTQGSIWLQPGFPATNQTFRKEAFLADAFDCKSKTYYIDIRNCWDEFYVYNLTRTTYCPEAYCFGTESPCPSGQYSKTGWTPGCGLYPNDTITPTVEYAIEHSGIPVGRNNLDMPELIFKCRFTPAAMTNYFYDVIWFINDGEIVRFQGINSTNVPFETKLREDHWKGKHKMNMLVKCAIRVRYLEGSVPSPPQYSSVFEAGLKVGKQEYQVVEKETIKISVHLTVPLGCYQNTDQTPTSFKKSDEEYKKYNCILNLQTAIPTYQNNPEKYCQSNIEGEGIIFNNQRCGVVFFASNWSATRDFEVTGELDLQYNANDRAVFIRIATQRVIFHPIWSDIIFPDIKVKIVDKEFEVKDFMCHSVNDPHMKTFDGRKYEHHTPGEYILFKSLKFPIQVNAIYQYCNGQNGVTCNCGVAIKNADALFVANFCSGSYSATSFERNMYMERNFCDDTYMSIKKTGSMYTFSLPTGTDVSFSRIGNRGITYILIKPSELDLRATGGLCGFFSKGEKSDDFQKQDGTLASTQGEFTKDWSISDDPELRFLSLFDLNYQQSENDDKYPVKEFCVCRVNSTKYFPVDSAKMTCRLSEAIIRCTNKRVPKEIMNFECTEFSERYKREASTSRRLLAFSKVTKPEIRKIPIERVNVDSFPPYVEPDWRNGWTEGKARVECEKNILSSPATRKCMELLPRINSSESVEDCIKDIKLTGDIHYIESAQSALTALCLIEASKTEILTTKNDTKAQDQSTIEVNENEISLFETLLKVSCPKDCSGNGNCTEGACKCNEYYMGVDCSHRRSSPPDIIRRSEAQTCDLNDNLCSSVLVTGDMFSEDDIVCKINRFKVYANGEIVHELNAEILEGEPINDFSCICPLPTLSRRKRSISDKTLQAEGFVISISNGNGSSNFSEEFKLLTFNSACYECNTTSFECTEKSSCSKIGVSNEQKETDSILILVAVFGAAGGILIFIVIFIVIRKKCLSSKNACKPDLGADFDREKSILSYASNFDRPTSANSIFITNTH